MSRSSTLRAFSAALAAFLVVLLGGGTTTHAALLNPAGAGGGGFLWSGAFDAVDPNTIVIGGDVGGVYRTTDFGEHWSVWCEGLTNPDEGPSYYVEDLMGVSWNGGANTGFLAATRGGIYIRESDGAAWQNMTPSDHTTFDYTYMAGSQQKVLPFSCLDHTTVGESDLVWMVAGAGYARTGASAPDLGAKEAVWYTFYFSASGDPLSVSWKPIAGSDGLGSVRDIAVAYLEDVGQLPYVVATTSGVYYSTGQPGGAWQTASTAQDCWSVHLTARGSLYASFADGSVKRIADIRGAFNGWDPAYWESQWEKVGTLTDDMMHLSVFDGTGTGKDVLYAGGWPVWTDNGLWRCEVAPGDNASQVTWYHWVGRNASLWYRTRLGLGTQVSLDQGWVDFTGPDIIFHPVVAPMQQDRLLIQVNSGLHVYDPDADVWTQSYSNGGPSWSSRGWNELVVYDLDFDSSNRPLVATGDMGLLRGGANVDLSAFEPIGPEVPAEALTHEALYVENRANWLGLGQDALFLVNGDVIQGSKPGRVFMLYNDAWTNTMTSIANLDYHLFEDLVVADDYTVYVAYALYDAPIQAPGDPLLVEQGILRGTYTGGVNPPDPVSWSWEPVNAGLIPPEAPEPFNARCSQLLVHKGTGTIFMAARAIKLRPSEVQGIETTFDLRGGIYRLTGDTWQRVFYGSPAHQTANWYDFQSIAQSANGEYLYAGARGRQIGDGGVLKCVDPLNADDETNWTWLTEGNPFDFERPVSGQTWTLDYTSKELLDVRSLCVNPFNKDIVYAGLHNTGALPQEGLWGYFPTATPQWKRYPAAAPLEGIGLRAIRVAPDHGADWRHLITGTLGQELYWARVYEPDDGPHDPGCPFVYVHDGERYVEDNTILRIVPRDRAGKTEANVVDRYVLQTEPAALDGIHRIEIREFENEHSYIDRMQLLAVDHPKGTSVVATDAGRLIAHEGWLLPTSAQSRDGEDIRDLLVARDGRRFHGRAGDEILLRYPAPDAGAIGLITSTEPKDTAAPILGGGTVTSGIEVFYRDPVTGDWRSLGAFEPRERQAPQALTFSAGLLDGETAEEQSIAIRLRWHSDHDIDHAGLLVPREANLEVTELEMVEARDESALAVASELSDADGEFVELRPGEDLSLAFTTASPTERSRSFVLVTEGHYVKIDTDDAPIPDAFRLHGNAPNPFNPATTIRFDLPQAGWVSVKIYSVKGQLVRTLVDRSFDPGSHELRWAGVDERGRAVAAGVYFAVLETPFGTERSKMVLVK